MADQGSVGTFGETLAIAGTPLVAVDGARVAVWHVNQGELVADLSAGVANPPDEIQDVSLRDGWIDVIGLRPAIQTTVLDQASFDGSSWSQASFDNAPCLVELFGAHPSSTASLVLGWPRSTRRSRRACCSPNR